MLGKLSILLHREVVVGQVALGKVVFLKLQLWLLAVGEVGSLRNCCWGTVIGEVVLGKVLNTLLIHSK